MVKGDITQAIATYQQATRDYPGSPHFYVLLGQVYSSKRDWSKAREAYEKALQLKPNDPVASNNLANVILRNGGNADEALALAQVAHQLLPDSPVAADTLGWAYYQKGAYRLAVNILKGAIQLQQKSKAPENPDIYYHLGLAYQKMEQPALARQQFERALKINPDYVEAAEIKKQLSSLKS
jgi:tetratricopeptide (TPR) repeat protein